MVDLPVGASVTRQAGDGAVLLDVTSAAVPEAAPGLAELGIAIEALGPGGFRLRAAQDPSRLRAFLLSGPRLVLDVASGDTPLTLPPDATPVPEATPRARAVAESAPKANTSANVVAESVPEVAVQSPVPSELAPAPRAAEPEPSREGTADSAPATSPDATASRSLEPPLELRTLIVSGVEGSGLSVGEVMALEVELTKAAEVVDAPRRGGTPERMPLSQLARYRPEALQITRAALDSVAMQLADAYQSRGLARPEVYVLLGPTLSNRRSKPDGRIVLLVRPQTAAAPRRAP